MEQYGLVIGIALVLVVGLVSVLIGKQAAASVAKFREDHHERFTGRDAE